MKIVFNYTYYDSRYFLILLISCALIVFSSTAYCTTQSSKSDLELSFLKTNDSIKSTELYFNVLKIRNKSTKTIAGTVSFQCPENWKLIIFPINEITLNAGDSTFIPVHLSHALNATGGISYILTGTLKTNERMISVNTYIALPSKSSWDFTTNRNSIYFNENSPNSLFQIKLSNKGNTNELIKLHYKLGKLIMFSNNKLDEYTEFIDLPAYKDSIINKSITYKTNLSYSDKSKYERNWKESAIMISASNEKTEKISSVMVRKLNSSFVNERAESATPLNIDYQTYNLMSNQQPRSNLKVFGNVLFPNKREIQYIFGAQNIYYDRALNKDFNIENQLVYSLRYADKRNRIELGYNINGGSLHAINGRGIDGTFSFNSQNKLYYAFTQNTYTQNVGGFLGTNITSVRKKTPYFFQQSY